jgi:hypothetical protein
MDFYMNSPGPRPIHIVCVCVCVKVVSPLDCCHKPRQHINLLPGLETLVIGTPCRSLVRQLQGSRWVHISPSPPVAGMLSRKTFIPLTRTLRSTPVVSPLWQLEVYLGVQIRGWAFPPRRASTLKVPIAPKGFAKLVK